MMSFRRSLWLASTVLFLLAGVALLMTKDNLSHPLLRRLAVSDKKLGIVHLGKCHGIGMLLMIRKQKDSSELGKRPAKYYHMHRLVMDDHDEFLALVRDPIDRVRAAWAFEHPKNAHFRRSPHHHLDGKLPKANALYECYETFDDLARDGLGGAPWKDPCPILARELFGCVQPDVCPGIFHIIMNFGYYYTELLQQKTDSKKIYLVRNEHMVQDMNQINVMMGDSNANLFQNQHDSSAFSHWIDGTNSKTDLPVSGHQHISNEGYKHLCRVLCPELQIYKQLFARAVNINSKNVLDMMTSLRSKCPAEADLDDCPELFPTRIP
jgi:hypothetical protein